MSNAYRDPAHAAQDHYDRLGREAEAANYELSLDHQMIGFEFEGDEMLAAFSGEFTREGLHGDIECTRHNITEIYMIRADGISSFELDLASFKASYKEQLSKVEELVIDELYRRASKSQAWEVA